MSKSFRELGVSRPIVDALAARKIESPFRIQELVLPDALAGLDVLGRSPTGSGKTLAFAVPIVGADVPRRRLPVGARPRPHARACSAGDRRDRAAGQGQGPDGRSHVRRVAPTCAGEARQARARARRDAGPPGRSRAAPARRPRQRPDPRPRRGRPDARHGLQASGRQARAAPAAEPPDDVLLGHARRRGRRPRARVHEQPIPLRGRRAARGSGRDRASLRRGHDRFQGRDARRAPPRVVLYPRLRPDEARSSGSSRSSKASAMHGDMSQNARQGPSGSSRPARSRCSSQPTSRPAGARPRRHHARDQLRPAGRGQGLRPPDVPGRTGRAGRSGTAITLVLPEQQADTSRVARRLGHSEQYEQSGLESARAKVVYTSRRGRRSKW